MKFFVRLFGSLPLKLQYANARVLEFLIKDVVRYRAKVVRENIDSSFPEKDEKERKRIFKGFYRYFSRLVVEFFWECSASRRRLASSGLVRIKNPELLDSLSRGNDKSVVIMSAHHSNFELIHLIAFGYDTSKYEGIREENTSTFYLKMKSKASEETFKSLRLRSFDVPHPEESLVDTFSMMRFIVSHSKEKRYYIVNTDQFPYLNTPLNMKVNFLGRETYTMSGGAAVAVKYGMPVVFLSMMTAPDGKFDYTYKLICPDASALTAQQIMDKYYELLTEDIKVQPETYLWSHKRFKTRTDNYAKK